MKFLLSTNTPTEVSDLAKKIALCVTFWFIVVCCLAFTGRFERPSAQPPWAVIAAFGVPIVVFLLCYRISQKLRLLVRSIDLPLAIALQGWRFGGIGFLGLYAHGLLPGFFAWPAGLGDVAVGVSAPWLAFQAERNPAIKRSMMLFAWNIFGLLDFVIAMLTGVLCSGIATRTFGEITTEPMSQLPLVFVPTFFVPLYSILHIVGLFQSMSSKGAQRD